MRTVPLALTTLALLGLGLFPMSAVQAGDVIIRGRGGRLTQTETNRQKTEDGLLIERTTTLPKGQTRTSSGTFNGTGDGNYNGSVTRTTRQGETYNYQVDGQRSRGDGSYQNSATITGPGGKQTTVNTNGSYGNRRLSGDRAVTYPSGQTRTVEVNGLRRGRGRYTGTINVTGRDGQTRTGRFWRTR